MSPAATITESQPLILHLGPILQKMSDHEFFAFCQSNPEWRLKRTFDYFRRAAPAWVYAQCATALVMNHGCSGKLDEKPTRGLLNRT